VTDSRRTRSLGILLASSIGLNAALLAYLARIGTFERALVMVDLVDRPGDRSEARARIVERFRKLPSGPADVVFAGDSLIHHGPWAEFYSDIRNRGIRGDTSAGLLARLDELIGGRPREVYLLIGTNDLAAKVPDAQIERNYRAILARIAAESPATRVVVLAVLPVNRGLPGPPNHGNDRVLALNRRIEAMTAEFPSYRYVDLGPSVADASGNLRADFTEDGLHLNVDGYLAIRDALGRLAPPALATGHPRAEPSP